MLRLKNLKPREDWGFSLPSDRGERHMLRFRSITLLVLLVVLAQMASTDSVLIGGVKGETIYSYEIVSTYSHDPTAFTQGLVFYDGFLYEGTGLYGESSLRKVRIEDGVVLKLVELDEEYFGEGITILGDRLFQLTWREGCGFVYDLATFEQVVDFTYETEGWGLTTDGKHLIMSDGSEVITYLDPTSYQPVKKIKVFDQDGPVKRLNELEYINGEIYANVWFTNWILQIDPQTGKVIGRIDLSELHHLEMELNPKVDVLNGIAYDLENNRLFVTGKLWSHIYEIELIR